MPAKVITFGIQKGGCSKSTSSGIASYLLSNESKVLAIDMDAQGNLTSFLSGEFDICNVFEEQTVLEGIINRDVRPYIVNIKQNLDLVPSNDYLVGISRAMMKRKMDMHSLTNALQPVMDDYDYIIIDTPPNLGEQTILSLSTYSAGGNYAVIMFDASMFAYYAIPKMIEIIDSVNNRYDVGLEIAGIAFAIVDNKSKEFITMKNLIDEDFPNKRFNSIIKRRAATRRLPIEGFESNKEITDALEYYRPFVKELKRRVEG